MAETLMVPGRGIEPPFSAPKTAVLPLDDPGVGRVQLSPITRVKPAGRPWRVGHGADSVARLMGSLIKKRRKRMRKKKHKKMLRRTRHQRRK